MTGGYELWMTSDPQRVHRLITLLHVMPWMCSLVETAKNPNLWYTVLTTITWATATGVVLWQLELDSIYFMAGYSICYCKPNQLRSHHVKARPNPILPWLIISLDWLYLLYIRCILCTLSNKILNCTNSISVLSNCYSINSNTYIYTYYNNPPTKHT